LINDELERIWMETAMSNLGTVQVFVQGDSGKPSFKVASVLTKISAEYFLIISIEHCCYTSSLVSSSRESTPCSVLPLHKVNLLCRALLGAYISAMLNVLRG
jgi:hypothetical protein